MKNTSICGGRGLTCFLEGTRRKLSAFQLAAQGDGVADLVGSMGCRSLRPKFCLIVGGLNYSRDAVTESARFGKRPLQVNCVPIESTSPHCGNFMIDAPLRQLGGASPAPTNALFVAEGDDWVYAHGSAGRNVAGG
jgi:hypothetical protein